MTALEARVERAFAEEAYIGLRFAVQVKLLLLVTTALVLMMEIPYPDSLTYVALLASLAMLALVQINVRKAGCDSNLKAAFFAFLEYAVMVGVLVTVDRIPAPMRLGFDMPMYICLMIALSALGSSPGLVLWSGSAALICWWLGWLYVILQPGVRVSTDEVLAEAAGNVVSVLTDPMTVQPGALARQSIVFAIMTLTLAGVAWRARLLVRRQVEVERERGNLARHFSPTVVQEIAAMDDPFREPKRMPVAILFADLVGFTRLTAGQDPVSVIALVQRIQRLLAGVVFDHGGTLDKFLGDGLMASFGTPRNGPDDTIRALAAARAMMLALDPVSRERHAAGLAPIRLSIGLHYGPVTLGNVGDDNRVEFTIIGETVNIAARLEKMTRPEDAAILASDDFLDRLRAEAPDDAAALLAGFVPLPPLTVRGLDRPLGAAKLPNSSAM